MKFLKILFLSLFTSTVIQLSAQDVNSSPILQIEEVSSKLKSATGWKMNSVNNWVSNENVISGVQLNELTRNTSSQNFKWIQLILVNYNNEKYYTLVYENEQADSATGSIEKRVNFYLMSQKDYMDLAALANMSTTEPDLVIHSSQYGYMSDKDGVYNQDRLLNLLKESIDRPKSVQYDLILQPFNKPNGTVVVRFRLPHPFSILDSGLEEEFFEISKADFSSNLLPLSIVQEKLQPEDSSFEITVAPNLQTKSNSNVTSDIQTRSNDNIAPDIQKESSNDVTLNPQTESNSNVAPNSQTKSSDNTALDIQETAVYEDDMPDRSPINAISVRSDNNSTGQNTSENSSLISDYYTNSDIATLVTNNQSSAQNEADPFDVPDRVSKEAPIISEPIALFADPVGWYYNSDGQWVNEDNHTYNFETVGRYEIRNVQYRGKRYLAFSKYQKYSGAIHYLLPADQFIMGVLNMDNSSMFKVPVITSCGIGYTLQEMIDKAVEVLDTPSSLTLVVIEKQYLTFQYRVSKAKDIARFFIFEEKCTQYGEDGGETCFPELPNTIKFDEVQLVGTNELFNKMYFETTSQKFMTFMTAPLQNTTKTAE